MGIKNLHQFLKRRCPGVYHTVSISSFQHCVVAIDLSIYLFKYHIMYGAHWLDALLNLMYKLEELHIRPIVVYDTKAPPEKAIERKMRSQARARLRQRLDIIKTCWSKIKSTMTQNRDETYDLISLDFLWDEPFLQFVEKFAPTMRFSARTIDQEIQKLENSLIHITGKEFNITRELFDILGIPIVDSEGEAEATCAAMNKKGLVDAVLTEDTDVLAYACPRMLTQIDLETGVCVEIRYDEVVGELQLANHAFLDFCILCGTDYNRSIHRSSDRAYQMIRQYGSIEAIAHHIPNFPLEPLNHIRMREIFNYELPDVVVIPSSRPPDMIRLQLFCFHYNCRLALAEQKTKLTTDLNKTHRWNKNGYPEHVRVL